MKKNTVQTATVFKTENTEKIMVQFGFKIKRKDQFIWEKNQNKKLENTKKIMILTAFGLLFL